MDHLDLRILCGQKSSLSKEEFLTTTPLGSIALDGAVRGGPFFENMHLNLDHHENVYRPATMSAARQIYFALKGGLMRQFLKYNDRVPTFINDCDQDVSLAVWLLENYPMFEGTRSFKEINRLIELNDRLDITGGAFPMDIAGDLVETYNWIFEPYQDLSRSGALGEPTEEIIKSGIEGVSMRIGEMLVSGGGRKPIDTSHEILHRSTKGYSIIHELGGSGARLYLFSQGMEAFISLKAEPKPDHYIYSIGRIAPWTPFPLQELYDLYNKEEGRTRENGWNGSDLVGGHRGYLSRLHWKDLAKITDEYITTNL